MIYKHDAINVHMYYYVHIKGFVGVNMITYCAHSPHKEIAIFNKYAMSTYKEILKKKYIHIPLVTLYLSLRGLSQLYKRYYSCFDVA